MNNSSISTLSVGKQVNSAHNIEENSGIIQIKVDSIKETHFEREKTEAFKDKLNSLLINSDSTKDSSLNGHIQPHIGYNTKKQHGSFDDLSVVSQVCLHVVSPLIPIRKRKQNDSQGTQDRPQRNQRSSNDSNQRDRPDGIKREGSDRNQRDRPDSNWRDKPDSNQRETNQEDLSLQNEPVSYLDWMKDVDIQSICDSNKSVIIDVEPSLKTNMFKSCVQCEKSSKSSSTSSSECSETSSYMNEYSVHGQQGKQGWADLSFVNVACSASGRPLQHGNTEIAKSKLLRKMLKANECPYNEWIYKEASFPSHQTLWECSNSSVTQTQFSTNPSTQTSSLPSTPPSPRHRISPVTNFSSAPTMTLPPPPLLALPSPPSVDLGPSFLVSPYPIVTLPRISRKQRPVLVSRALSQPVGLLQLNLYRLFCQCLLPSLSDLPKPAHVVPLSCGPLVPPSNGHPRPCSLSRSSSVSCSCSSVSSCSTCINVPKDPSTPYAFTTNPNNNSKTSKHCDQICFVVGCFVVVAVLALASILAYLALNTKLLTNGMTTH